jgi:hypothetical protein
MLDFLIEHSKTFGIKTFQQPKQFKEEFFKLFCEKLNQSYISTIERTEDTIRFKAPVSRFAWNGWNVFNPVSHGLVCLKDVFGDLKIEYRFCFWEFFAIALLMSFPGIIALTSGLANWGIAFLVLDWFGFYAISRVIAAFRLNSLVAGIVQSVNNPSVLHRDFDAYLKEEWRFIDQVFFNENYKDAVG